MTSRPAARRRGRSAVVGAGLLVSGCLLAPASLVAQARPGVARVDGVAAIVGATVPTAASTVILQSDVELRARMRLVGEGDTEAATRRLPAELLGAVLDELVGEALLAREAARTGVSSPTPAAIDEERRRLAMTTGGEPRLAELLRVLGVGADELEAAASRRAAVSAFLTANLTGTASVSDAELERVFAAGDHPFVGRPLAEVEGELRALVARRALERAVRRWVGVLRGRVPVRVLVRYAP